MSDTWELSQSHLPTGAGSPLKDKHKCVVRREVGETCAEAQSHHQAARELKHDNLLQRDTVGSDRKLCVPSQSGTDDRL